MLVRVVALLTIMLAMACTASQGPNSPLPSGAPTPVEIIILPTDDAAAAPKPVVTPSVPKTPTPLPTSVAPLPALRVEGAQIIRTDTRQPVWLKGANVVEFWSSGPHTFAHLYEKRGLKKVVEGKWGLNFLRVALDIETFDGYVSELDKLLDFASAQGIYCLLVPFASTSEPTRDENHLPIPDQRVADFMGTLAARYAQRTNVLYGLWNESHPESITGLSNDMSQAWQLWMDAATNVASAIRQRNAQALIIAPGGVLYSRDLSYYRTHPLPFDNLSYDVHDYYAPPTYAPEYPYSREMWTWVINRYPLMLNEFGGACCTVSVPPVQSEHDIQYIHDVFQIVNSHPQFVHYALWVLDSADIGGTFDGAFDLTPRGRVLLDDLRAHPPTQFRP